jgi:hypothetical protein
MLNTSFKVGHMTNAQKCQHHVSIDDAMCSVIRLNIFHLWNHWKISFPCHWQKVNSQIFICRDFWTWNHYKRSWLFKRPTWPKCPHWPKGMSILIKGLGHDKHMLHFINTFNYFWK